MTYDPLPPRQPDYIGIGPPPPDNPARDPGYPPGPPPPPDPADNPGQKIREGSPWIVYLGGAAIVAMLVVAFIAVGRSSTAVAPPPWARPFDTPYRVFQIGSDRVTQIKVCGSRARFLGAAGTEQGCVAVEVPEEWGDWTARAVVCGTQVYAADTGQPCNAAR